MRERPAAGSAVEGRRRPTDRFFDVRIERSGLLAEGWGGRGRLRESISAFNPGGKGGNGSSIGNAGEERDILLSKWRGDMGRSKGSDGDE